LSAELTKTALLQTVFCRFYRLGRYCCDDKNQYLTWCGWLFLISITLRPRLSQYWHYIRPLFILFLFIFPPAILALCSYKNCSYKENVYLLWRLTFLISWISLFPHPLFTRWWLPNDVKPVVWETISIAISARKSIFALSIT